VRASLLALPLLAGCAATPVHCPPSTQAATIAEAYFGRAVRDRAEVTEAEWTAFLAEVVTPAFPDGLTAFDGAGHWRDGAGRILQERSKVLVVILPGEDATTARTRLRSVEDAWKTRFRQQSVLTTYRPACVAF